MTNTAVTGPVRMRAFLFDDGTGADTAEVIGRKLSEQGVARTALGAVHRLSRSAVHTVDREVGTVVDGLLDVDLGDIIVACWRKHRALKEAAQRTLATPGTEEVVALASHEATATYRPYVDLLVDGFKVTTLEFELAVTIRGTGVAAVVRNGDLVAVEGGDCLAKASLSLEGACLAERQQKFDPALTVNLHPGIALVRKPERRSSIPEQGKAVTATSRRLPT